MQNSLHEFLITFGDGFLLGTGTFSQGLAGNVKSCTNSSYKSH